jgi:hypothetical protein
MESHHGGASAIYSSVPHPSATIGFVEKLLGEGGNLAIIEVTKRYAVTRLKSVAGAGGREHPSHKKSKYK